MENRAYGEDEVPLLTALPLFQRLAMSGFNGKHFRFTKTQFMIFSALALSESLTMSEVAEYISSSHEQATRSIAPLVTMGYVERFVNTDNRTKVHVRLTDAGRGFLTELSRDYYGTIKKRLDNSITEDDRQRLRDAVGTIIEIMRKIK